MPQILNSGVQKLPYAKLPQRSVDTGLQNALNLQVIQQNAAASSSVSTQNIPPERFLSRNANALIAE